MNAFSDSEEPALGSPRPVPPPPPVVPHASSSISTMAYVPPPDTAPTLAALSAVLRGAFATHSDCPTTTVSTSSVSQNPAVAQTAPTLAGSSHISRFSATPRQLIAIPPPGLIDPEQLKYMIKVP